MMKLQKLRIEGASAVRVKFNNTRVGEVGFVQNNAILAAIQDGKHISFGHSQLSPTQLKFADFSVDKAAPTLLWKKEGRDNKSAIPR